MAKKKTPAKRPAGFSDGSALYQPPDNVLAKGAQTEHYLVIPFGPSMVSYSARPYFTITTAEQMLWDQQVWFGLQLGNAPLMQAEVEVKSPSREIAQFVQEQWDRLWAHEAWKIMLAKYYGWAGFEVVYTRNRGLWEIKQLRDIHPRDVRPLVARGGQPGGTIAGISIRGQRSMLRRPEDLPNPDADRAGQFPTRLYGMQGLWLNYNAYYGSNFGRALTEKSYPAWWDKAMPGGAYDMRRLRAIKDAWIGDVMKYPSSKSFPTPSGEIISGKDIAREIMENRASGGVVALPSDRDGMNNPLFEYQPPTTVAPSQVIKEWIDDSDWDIFDGLLIPREVVEAASSGSGYSGRSFPMIMFLGLRELEFRGYVQPIKRQIMEPLVTRNFGEIANDFEIEPVKFLDLFTDQVGGGSEGGPIGGSGGSSGGGGGFHSNGSPDGRPAAAPGGGGSAGAHPATIQFRANDDDDETGGGRWVTLENGVHVKILNGVIVAGPAALMEHIGKGGTAYDFDFGANAEPKEKPAEEKPRRKIPTNTLSSGAQAEGKRFQSATGKYPHEATAEEYENEIDPHKTKWQAGQQLKHLEWVKHGVIYDPDSIPTEVLRHYAGDDTSIQNELISRREAEARKPKPPTGGATGKPAESPPSTVETPESATGEPTAEAPAKRPRIKGESKLDQAVLSAAEEWDVDPHDLRDVVREMHRETKNENSRPEVGKRAARVATGLTAADISKVENAGYDYASAHKLGGNIGKKMAQFDAVAQELAREVPELNIGDPDDPNADFGAALWELLSERSTGSHNKSGDRLRATDVESYNPTLIRRAAEYLKNSSRYDMSQYADVPFSIANEELRAKERLSRAAAVLSPFDPVTRRLMALLKKN